MIPDLPPILPDGAEFRFGESPFRVKGVLYLGTQTFFEQNMSRGLNTLAEEIDHPDVRAFITQKFLTGGWYDVMPVPVLIAYEARALRMSLEGYLRHRTKWQAKQDLGGVYKYLLRLASPGLVASQLPRLMLQMFDFARAKTLKEGANEREARFFGVPLPLQQWLHNALSIYAETAMKMAGAHFVECPPPDVQPEGTRGGIPLVNLTMHLRWE